MLVTEAPFLVDLKAKTKKTIFQDEKLDDKDKKPSAAVRCFSIPPILISVNLTGRCRNLQSEEECRIKHNMQCHSISVARKCMTDERLCEGR